MLTVKLDNPPPSHLNAFQPILACVGLQRFSFVLIIYLQIIAIYLSEKGGKKDDILQCIPESTRVFTFCEEKQAQHHWQQ